MGKFEEISTMVAIDQLGYGSCMMQLKVAVASVDSLVWLPQTLPCAIEQFIQMPLFGMQLISHYQRAGAHLQCVLYFVSIFC